MRKNLLLIAFAMLSAVSANADVTCDVANNKVTTTTINEITATNVTSLKELTSLIVVGPLTETDLYNLGKVCTKVTSLDLTDATFPNGDIRFTKNDDNSFVKNVTKLKLPTASTMTSIPENAFQYSSIANLVIPGNFTTIGKQAFFGCTKLATIVLNEGVKEIGEQAFEQASMSSIRLPNTLTTIGMGAFRDCKELTSITIPESVTTIASQAFNNTKCLRDIYVLGLSTSISSDSFDDITSGFNATMPQASKETATREDYWDKTENKGVALLHYPIGKTDKEKTDNAAEFTNVVRNGEYSLIGTDSIMSKYPTIQENCQNLKNLEGWNNEGWRRFILSSPFTPEQVIIVPTITDDKWYTMCFDFPMTKGQIESAFGGGTVVCDFRGVRKSVDGNNTTMTLDFSKPMFSTSTSADSIITVAGNPYMIHPATAPATGENNSLIFRVSGVEKDPDVLVASSVMGIDAITDTKNEFYPKDAYYFVGNLGEQKTVSYGEYYLGQYKTSPNAGKRAFFYNSRTDNSLIFKANSAIIRENTVNGQKQGYMKDHNMNSQAKTANLFSDETVEFTSSSTTSIENTETENNNTSTISAKFADKVFNINGQLVRTDSNSLDNLAKGMYIVNGKKYIVR